MNRGFDWRMVAILARQELRITLRNRWVLVYAVVFATLTLAVSYFGLAVIQIAGLSIAHALAALIGFSFTGILVGVKMGTYGIGSYLTLVGFAILVGRHQDV